MSAVEKRKSVDCMEIFSRNLGSISEEQQGQLARKKVAVLGCGGLGGFVLEQLVRLGIGTVYCFDPDVFTASNCNRQLGALMSTLGLNKARVASERAAAIHPFSTVVPFAADFRTVEDSQAFAVDVVVDCLDDIAARHDLAAICHRRALFLVHGAVHGWSGQVGVLPPGGTLFQKLYPQGAAMDGSVMHAPSVLSCTVACTASIQVAEVAKLLLDIDTELLDHALYLDLRDLEFMVVP